MDDLSQIACLAALRVTMCIAGVGLFLTLNDWLFQWVIAREKRRCEVAKQKEERGGELIDRILPLEERLQALEKERGRLLHAVVKQGYDIEQILGKALGYPSGYPDVSEVDDGSVCVMDHTPETLAMEAARVIVTLKAEVARLNELAEKLVLGTLPIKESIRLQQQIKGPMDWEKFSMLCAELCDCNTCDTCLDRYREE